MSEADKSNVGLPLLGLVAAITLVAQLGVSGTTSAQVAGAAPSQSNDPAAPTRRSSTVPGPETAPAPAAPPNVATRTSTLLTPSNPSRRARTPRAPAPETNDSSPPPASSRPPATPVSPK